MMCDAMRVWLAVRWTVALKSLAFASALAAAAEVTASDVDARANKEREFKSYLLRAGPQVLKQYVRQRDRMSALRAQVSAREAAGQSTACSHQILAEASWLASSVMKPDRIEKRLDDLEHVLAHPDMELRAEQQDPSDGSWGACHDEWFFRVNATYDHLTTPSNRAVRPRYRLRVFDRVNSPQKLQAYFESLAVSDLPGAGIDHRRELNESLANLMRLILRGEPAYYPWHANLKAAIMELILHRLRNPSTGWWGERYARNGHIEFVDDLSITFHVISCLNGDVPNLAPAMDHLLAVKDLNYPIGWLEDGQYSNHNNMDVVTLFGFGWRDMDDAQRGESAVEIQKMLDWCLRDSLQPDGSFAPDAGTSDSLEESNSWGVRFLERIGFFDPQKRFWTDQSFAQAVRIRERLIGYIEKHLTTGGAGGAYYEGDLERLRAARPGN